MHLVLLIYLLVLFVRTALEVLKLFSKFNSSTIAQL
jgi:hypothetical protein